MNKDDGRLKLEKVLINGGARAMIKKNPQNISGIQ